MYAFSTIMNYLAAMKATNLLFCTPKINDNMNCADRNARQFDQFSSERKMSSILRCEESLCSSSGSSSDAEDAVPAMTEMTSRDSSAKAQELQRAAIALAALECEPFARKRKTDEALADDVVGLYDLGTPVFKRSRRTASPAESRRNKLKPRSLFSAHELKNNVCEPAARYSPLLEVARYLEAKRAKLRRQPLGSVLRDLRCKVLGAGTYACVLGVEVQFGLEREPLWIAAKPVKSPLELGFDEFVDDRCDQLGLMMETHFVQTIGLHLLSLTDASSARCPNFVAAVAFEQSDAALSVEMREGIAHSKLSSMPCMHSAIYGELCDRGAVVRLAAGTDRLSANCDAVLTDPRKCFSLVAQTLLAIASMARCGISHNDVNLANIMERAVPEQAVLRYELPADFVVQPTSRGSCRQGDMEFARNELCLRTAGSLFCVGDFGMASATDWEDQDPRTNPDFEWACETLCDYYYEHVPDQVERTLVPKDMLLVTADEKANWRHPLLFSALRRHERDVASFLSHVVVMLRDLHAVYTFSKATLKYVRAALRQLALQRPDTGEKMMSFVHSVLRPSFLQKFFPADFIQSQLFETNQRHTGELHVYKLPTREQGQKAHVDLCQRLSSKVPTIHSWTILDNKIQS